MTGVLVFFTATPLALWALEQADVISGSRLIVDSGTGWAFLLLCFAWMFAIVLVGIIALELIWPSTRKLSPVARVRSWAAGQRRGRRYAQIAAIASKHGLDGVWGGGQ